MLKSRPPEKTILALADDTRFYLKLNALPVVGGVNAYLKSNWDTTKEFYLAYGSKLTTIQDVVDYIKEKISV